MSELYEKSLQKLELPQVLQLLSACAGSIGGKEACLRLSPTTDLEEVELLLREGCKLVPSLATTRIIRAYAGVRPLVASDDDPSGRNVSRGIVLLDHSKRDGIFGFITITGGKLTSYRLMAEKTTDLLCSKLGVERTCQTAVLPLPGSEKEKRNAAEK